MKKKIKDISIINPENYSKKDLWDKIYYLDTGSIIKNSIEQFQVFKVEEDNIPSRAKRKVVKNDIIYSTVRPIQKHYGFFYENPKKNLLVSTGFVVIRVIESLANPKFIYAFLTLEKNIDYLQSIAEQSTSTYPSIKPEDLYNLDIELPNLKVQNFIGNLYINLEKKIENLKKINNIFLKIGKQIFDSYFVDFKIKKNNDYIQKELVDSEIGKIPKKWKILKIKDIVRRIPIAKKYNTQNILNDGKIPVIDQTKNEILGYHNENDFIPASLEKPVMTFANHTCNIRLMTKNFSTIQNVIPLAPTKTSVFWLYFRSIDEQKFEEYKGHIPDFLNTKIALPNDSNILNYFEKLIQPIVKKIFRNTNEIELLNEVKKKFLYTYMFNKHEKEKIEKKIK